MAARLSRPGLVCFAFLVPWIHNHEIRAAWMFLYVEDYDSDDSAAPNRHGRYGGSQTRSPVVVRGTMDPCTRKIVPLMAHSTARSPLNSPMLGWLFALGEVFEALLGLAGVASKSYA